MEADIGGGRGRHWREQLREETIGESEGVEMVIVFGRVWLGWGHGPFSAHQELCKYKQL
jgi:hypothetical protein